MKKILERFNINYETTGHKLTKAHRSDSGFDIMANVSSDVILDPGAFKMIDTGIRLDIPLGLEVQVRPRSGLATKFGITVLNSPGTIDSGYRGEVKVILINHGTQSYTIRNGEKIAQLVVAKVLDVEMLQVSKVEINTTDRMDKGFGSTDDNTGKK